MEQIPVEQQTAKHPAVKLPTDVDALMTKYPDLGERDASELYDRVAAGEDEASAVRDMRKRIEEERARNQRRRGPSR